MINNRVLKALTKAYGENGIALVLGAGVSCSSNIPSWRELMSRMVRKHVEGADGDPFADLTEADLPLPVIASFLQEQFKDRHDFVEAIREALYQDFPFWYRKTDKSTRGEVMRFIRQGQVNDAYKKHGVEYKPNPTLRSVGAFCTVRRLEKNRKGGPVFRNFANPRVRAIVTLNMDALLQTYVNTFSTKHLIRAVERPTAEPYEKAINLYHMHGYLHFNPNERSQEVDSAEGVVLTELDYYDFFNKPNSMFNYTFLYLLREYPCLFIGLSMQDENIRRLLNYSKLERMQALANKKDITLKELGGRQALIEKKIRRHIAILQRHANSQVNLANRQTLDALGVKVVWVDSFSEIPDLLQGLYESSPEDRDHWVDVYGREQG